MVKFIRERVIGTEPHSFKTWIKVIIVITIGVIVLLGIFVTVSQGTTDIKRSSNLIFYNTTTDLPNYSINQVTVYIDVISVNLDVQTVRTSTDFLAGGVYGGNAGPNGQNIFYQPMTFVMDNIVRFIPSTVNPTPAYSNFLIGGDINTYPYDVYSCIINLQMFQNGTNIFNATPVPFSVVFAGYLAGFDFSSSSIATAGTSGGQANLTIKFSRSNSAKIMAMIIIIYQWLVTIVCFGMAVDILIRKRPIHPPLPIFFGVMFFAMPALRSAQPGVPPPGSLTDFFSFTWNMILLSISFLIVCTLYVFRFSKKKAAEETEQQTMDQPNANQQPNQQANQQPNQQANTATAANPQAVPAPNNV